MSSEQTNSSISILVSMVSELPYKDQLTFLGELLAHQKPLMLSSGCSAIAHGLFNHEMKIADLPITEETNRKMKYLGELQGRLWDLNKELHQLSKKETEEKYGSNV